MCDIDNPLCGPSGAAAVFAPQKGADAAMVERLDNRLFHLARVLRRDLGAEVLALPGGGAAGGFGAGAAAFFGSPLRMGNYYRSPITAAVNNAKSISEAHNDPQQLS